VIDHQGLDDMMSKYLAQAKRSKPENRMIFNHVCIRVEDLDRAEELLCNSFGIDGFLSPGGGTFDDEQEFRVAWLDDNNMYLEISQFDEQQEIGYDTGVGQPIGHLSEIGFFVPDMDEALEHLDQFGWKVTSRIYQPGARMYKIDTDTPSGIPVELVDIDIDPDEPETVE
jgi:catechol 2,3-dioxygenase-like lactoylglutathione lyase family enzyme